MAEKQTFEDKLQACIAGLLRDEYPSTSTSIINDVSGLSAGVAQGLMIERRKENERRGVRPLDFMDLPPELRNRIYEMLLRFDQFGHHIIQLDEGPLRLWFHGTPGYGHPACQPAITRTSRRIRDETLAIFYSINTFSINLRNAFATVETGSVPQFEKWLERIGETNTRSVGRVISRTQSNDPEMDRTRSRIYLSELDFRTRIEQLLRVSVVDHDGAVQ